jgi:predicted signal transduction protein with EAL and GGDEF domain
MAMYWAKSEGRRRYRVFDSSMDDRLQQRIELDTEIAGAIAAGQIVPYYQPIVDLQRRRRSASRCWRGGSIRPAG